jgi:hypothetical protein
MEYCVAKNVDRAATTIIESRSPTAERTPVVVRYQGTTAYIDFLPNCWA